MRSLFSPCCENCFYTRLKKHNKVHSANKDQQFPNTELLPDPYLDLANRYTLQRQLKYTEVPYEWTYFIVETQR